ncbi:hypothetical protein NKG94_16470 [Micromonospora sp. M12]
MTNTSSTPVNGSTLAITLPSTGNTGRPSAFTLDGTACAVV